jgi:2-oxo-4-hydroxy-4-carboxy-5-ureidoimidazoline decarboxylase
MAEAHVVLNGLAPDAASAALRRCCGAERWVASMSGRRPFASTEELLGAADQEWQKLGREDYLEAFAQHPQIGEDLQALRQRFGATLGLASQEQAGVAAADDAKLLALREGNREYLSRFGFIFIVCASGKSAEQMLAALRARLTHDSEAELRVAAAEQAKITRLRLQGLSA